MAKQKVSLAFLNEEGDKQLIGVFSCLKNALNKIVKEGDESLLAMILEGAAHLEIYSMYNNEWIDLDACELEFTSTNKEDLATLEALA